MENVFLTFIGSKYYFFLSGNNIACELLGIQQMVTQTLRKFQNIECYMLAKTLTMDVVKRSNKNKPSLN